MWPALTFRIADIACSMADMDVPDVFCDSKELYPTRVTTNLVDVTSPEEQKYSKTSEII